MSFTFSLYLLGWKFCNSMEDMSLWRGCVFCAQCVIFCSFPWAVCVYVCAFVWDVGANSYWHTEAPLVLPSFQECWSEREGMNVCSWAHPRQTTSPHQLGTVCIMGRLLTRLQLCGFSQRANYPGVCNTQRLLLFSSRIRHMLAVICLKFLLCPHYHSL